MANELCAISGYQLTVAVYSVHNLINVHIELSLPFEFEAYATIQYSEWVSKQQQ